MCEGVQRMLENGKLQGDPREDKTHRKKGKTTQAMWEEDSRQRELEMKRP